MPTSAAGDYDDEYDSLSFSTQELDVLCAANPSLQRSPKDLIEKTAIPLTPPPSARTAKMWKPPIVIRASNLASCVGLNRYCSLAEGAETVFARSYPRAYRKALARIGQTIGPTVEEILEELSATAAVELAIGSSATDLAANLRSLLVRVGGIDSEIAKDVQKHVFMERGARGEAKTLTSLETTMKQNIGERNDRLNVLQLDTMPSGRRLRLSGRVDGIAADGTLVEVKNRQRCFAGRVRLHEKVQVHAYMELMGIQSCIIAETYDGGTRSDRVEFDAGFWFMIVSRLTRFARHVDRLLDDEALQDALLVDGDFPCDFIQEAPPLNV
ncbi:hypothetical protein HDU87_006781 [Geranomyces variabilis]|uniref:Uncharacterized protein n=1 Tax=Geranomyces variabilis TaxID=109894 RepID=A0AAD5TRX1_9FUNG|nr:hypothetical protein HDU87_006781 [Geranomyces variabilis]